MSTSPRADESRAYYLANRERIKARAAAYRAENPDKVKAGKRAHYEANKAAILAKNAAYKWPKKSASGKANYARNRDETRAKHAEHYQANMGRYAARGSAYAKANRGILRARDAKRRASQRNATPAWLTDGQIKEMKALYVRAAGLGQEVDHIVPLNGKTVCGLHVPWNLQILPAVENRRKAAKLLPCFLLGFQPNSLTQSASTATL